MLSTNLLIINIISILLMLVASITSMKCIQCHTDDNSLCLEIGSRDCPKNQAYDSCMTTIYRNPTDGLHIKKECALAPCVLRGASKVILSFSETCKDEREDCVYCCNKDGCNTDGVSNISVHKLLIISMVSMIMIFPFISFNF